MQVLITWDRYLLGRLWDIRFLMRRATHCKVGGFQMLLPRMAESQVVRPYLMVLWSCGGP